MSNTQLKHPHSIMLRVDQKTLAKIERVAKQLGGSRTQAVRLLVGEALAKRGVK